MKPTPCSARVAHRTQVAERIARTPRLFFLLTATALFASATTAHSQVSLTAAVDMALRNSPRVKMAETDVDRARAGLSQSKDVYVPTLVGTTSGLGYAYGFPLGPPTVFTFSAGSLVFSYSQKDYIRAATAGLVSSNLALQDVRQSVAEDTVNTYLSLARAQQQHAALAQESGFAQRLEIIVKERLDAGTDSAMEYTKARRTNVQIRLQMLQLDDEIATQNDHLSRLLGLAGSHVDTVPDSIPPIQLDTPTDKPATTQFADTPGVQAAFSTAHQKLEQAFGDARYLWRPQITFGAQYSKEAFYNNTYVTYYPGVTGNPPGSLPAESAGFALNVTVPIYDRSRKDRAHESMAEAMHAQHDAEKIRDQELEGRLKLQHSTAELQARAELASLDRDMAQEQLDAILIQLQAPAGTGPALTPKEEQNARIQERQRFIEMLDAQYQLRQAQISLLRQTNRLESWLKQVDRTTVNAVP